MIVTEFLARLGVSVDRGSFSSAEMRLRGLGSSLRAAAGLVGGLFAAAQVKSFVQELTAQGAALKDMADRTGVSASALQQLGLAAELAGSSQEGLETGLKFLGRNASAATSGSKEMAKAFRDAGIAVKDSAGNLRGPEELLGDVADALQRTQDPSERTALAMRLLGRSGAELIPTLKDGAAGLAAVRQEAIDLGGGLSDELITNADELDDNLTRLRFSLLSLKSVIGNGILPVVDRAARGFMGLVRGVQELWRKSRFLQYALVVITAALVGFGVAAAWAARQAIVAWLKTAAPFLAAAAAIAAIAAALDDVHQLLTGGKSLIGQYLDEWFGIGTADQLVRSWAQGIESLTATIREFVSALMTGGELLDALIHFDFERASKTKLVKFLSGAANDVGSAVGAYRATLAGEDAPVPRAERGLHGAELIEAAPGTPRARARGLKAKLLQGSAGFGTAGPGAAAAKAAASGFAGLFTGATPLMAPAAVSSGNRQGTVNVGGASVTVNAQTGADAREIAREAEKAARRINQQQASQVRHALAGRTARNNDLGEFAGTLDLSTP